MAWKIYNYNLEPIAEYQHNHLMCWAAVALTAYRFKYGKSGIGRSLDSFMMNLKNDRYKNIYLLAIEIESYEGGNAGFDEMIRDIKRKNPRLADAPTGLPSGWADDFFKSELGMRAMKVSQSASASSDGSLPAGDGPAVVQFIDKSKISVIFTRNAAGGGHLRLITGYAFDQNSQWSKDNPQIKIWDPEHALLAEEAELQSNPASRLRMQDFKNKATKTLLWEHFSEQIVKKLAVDSLYCFA